MSGVSLHHATCATVNLLRLRCELATLASYFTFMLALSHFFRRLTFPACFEQATENLWLCLICGHVGCGRYINGHAFAHFKQTGHTFSLDMVTQRVSQPFHVCTSLHFLSEFLT